MSFDPVAHLALWLAIPFISNADELRALSLTSRTTAALVCPWLFETLKPVHTDRFSLKSTSSEQDFPRALLVSGGWRHANYVRSIEVCVCDDDWDTVSFETPGHLVEALVDSLPSLQRLSLRSHTTYGVVFDLDPVLRSLKRAVDLRSVDFGLIAESDVPSHSLAAGVGLESLSFRPARREDEQLYVGLISLAARTLRHLCIETTGCSRLSIEESRFTAESILERIECPRLDTFEVISSDSIGVDEFTSRHPTIDSFTCAGGHLPAFALSSLPSLRKLTMRNIAIQDEAFFVTMLSQLPNPSLLRRLELAFGTMTSLASPPMLEQMRRLSGLDELVVFTYPYWYFYLDLHQSCEDQETIESSMLLVDAVSPSIRRVVFSGAFPLPVKLPQRLHTSHKVGGPDVRSITWAREIQSTLVCGTTRLAHHAKRLEMMEWYPWPELCEIGVDVHIHRHEGDVEIGGGLGRRGGLVSGYAEMARMRIKQYDYLWAVKA